MMEPDVNELKFEDALARLDEIVGQLEEGELALETSLKLFEEGQLLARRCTELLDQAELRVEALTADGELVKVDTG